MSTGTSLMNRVLNEVGRLRAVRIFRHNVGMGWAGKPVTRRADGSVIVRNARPLHAGLVVGGSDLIGWTTREIGPEDVGTRVAVFTAIEVKDGDHAPTTDQANFLEQVRRAGGVAGVARSVEDALRLVGADER